jgi:hypothetical protein
MLKGLFSKNRSENMPDPTVQMTPDQWQKATDYAIKLGEQMEASRPSENSASESHSGNQEAFPRR